jgi:thiamine pyrophosphate-dependent acetolactate synthase large subunit-like protein
MDKKLNETPQIGAQLVVRVLEAQGVTHVFGIPGANIDSVFNSLVDSKIQTVVCRHEQNAVELETAVRLKANIVHLVWIDGTYDMVATQEVLKYGRKSGIEFGPVDLVKYAEAFGATGRMIRNPEEITPVMKEALDHTGPNNRWGSRRLQ